MDRLAVVAFFSIKGTVIEVSTINGLCGNEKTIYIVQYDRGQLSSKTFKYPNKVNIRKSTFSINSSTFPQRDSTSFSSS